MRLVPTKSVEQFDLQAMHRVRARVVRHRTSVINQIRALPLERGIAVRQGARFLRAASPALNKQNVPAPSIQSTTYFIDLSWDYASENKDRITQALNDRKKLGSEEIDQLLGCVAIHDLWSLVVDKQSGILEFKTAELTRHMNGLARGQDLADSSSEIFTNEKRVGWLLRRLRFQKASPGKTKRRWRATRAEVEALARSYGVALPQEPNAENAKNAETQTPQIGVSASSACSALSRETKESKPDGDVMPDIQAVLNRTRAVVPTPGDSDDGELG